MMRQLAERIPPAGWMAVKGVKYLGACVAVAGTLAYALAGWGLEGQLRRMSR